MFLRILQSIALVLILGVGFWLHPASAQTPPPGIAPVQPHPPQTAYNLVGKWPMQFEKGSIVEGSKGGVVDDFAFSQFTVEVQPGQVNVDGSHSYQGTVPGWQNSSVNVWYVPNVAIGKQRYMEMYIYIPEPQFGTAMASYFYVACSMFVGVYEDYAWGLQKAQEYGGGPYTGGAQTPDSLSISKCNAYKQYGGKG